MRIDYTKVWRVNGKIVVAPTIEKAMAVYKTYCEELDVAENNEIESVDLIYGSEVYGYSAILDADEYQNNGFALEEE